MLISKTLTPPKHAISRHIYLDTMPFRYFTPGTIFLSLAIAGVMMLLGKPKKRSFPKTRSAEPYVPQMQRVLDSHSDCTAELFNIFVEGHNKVAAFSSLVPGDMMEVTYHDDSISFYARGTEVATVSLMESSHLPQVFMCGSSTEAFLGGRDVCNASEDAEFATVVIFYKIEGVPPTEIKLA